MKTAELAGPLLNYWTARAINLTAESAVDFGLGCPDWLQRFKPSTNWAHGGPIIDRDDIHLGGYATCRYAEIRGDSGPWIQVFGETSLIAAMRTKVASVYGDEVPDSPAMPG